MAMSSGARHALRPYVVLVCLASASLGGSGCSGTHSSRGAPGSDGGGVGGVGGGRAPSSGDGGAMCSASTSYSGAPIDSPSAAWQWVPIEGARCRDGSPTGLGIRRKPGATKLAIYFEGGGACFHDVSCAANPSAFADTDFAAWVTASGSDGIFDDSRADNPLRDWNMVFIPYCTGDVHAGAGENVDVPGLGPKQQQFVGALDVEADLQRLVPTFSDASEILVTGISAGGFGALLNFDRVSSAFCGVPTKLIDDSGPLMANQWLTPCLQQRWRQLWNLDETVLKDCPACRDPAQGGFVRYVDYLAQKYATSSLALISSEEDAVISTFFGFGQNDCAGLTGVPAILSGSDYAAGLADLRAERLHAAPWTSYYITSITHTWIGTSSTLYSTVVGGLSLTLWMRLLLDDSIGIEISP